MPTALQQLRTDLFGQSPNDYGNPIALVHLAESIDNGGGGNVSFASVLIGSGTVSGSPYQFQSAINYDPSTGADAVNRRTMFNTTLTYSSSTTNIWEGITAFTTVNGPGTANGEINVFHGNLTINPGATVFGGEAIEGKIENSGTVGNGGVSLGLYYWRNTATGQASVAFGTKYQLVNENSTPGAVTTYAAIDNEAMTGGGSAPTNNAFIRNGDPTGYILSLAGMSLGTFGTPDPGMFLKIAGSDNSNSTFPVKIYNLAAQNLFLLDNAGKAYFGTGLQTTIDGSGNIVAPSIGNGSTAFQVSGSGSYSANASVATVLGSIGPSGSHTTVQEWLTIKNASGVTRYIPCF